LDDPAAAGADYEWTPSRLAGMKLHHPEKLSCSFFMHYNDAEHAGLVVRRSPELKSSTENSHYVQCVPNDQAIIYIVTDYVIPSLEGLYVGMGQYVFHANVDAAVDQ
jgi:hypothetical protein